MSYKVTVIIPTYNSVEFLDSTIASIMNQSIGFENIELIIVDDYSTDNTQELINSYCEKYENIKTFEAGKKTGTPGRARNIGIANSTAEYIMFIDHDDNYLPESVEKLYNAVTENSCDVAIGKFQTFGEQKIVPEDWITHDVVLNSIESHHGDKEAKSVIAVLVSIADTLSAARPGARNDTMENYVKRLEELENIGNSFDGVDKTYAMQAGREVRVIVKPDEVDDLTSFKIAREIKEKIEAEMQYPATIKITVIRETRASEEAK